MLAPSHRGTQVRFLNGVESCSNIGYVLLGFLLEAQFAPGDVCIHEGNPFRAIVSITSQNLSSSLSVV